MKPVIVVAMVLALSLCPTAATRAHGAGSRGVAGRPAAGVLAAEARRSGLRARVLELALRAYECGRRQGEFQRPILTVIDYSLPSTEPRLWVLDLARGRVLFHELVAHGQNSGENLASAFSNHPGSRQSSLGVFRADETYLGQHGHSLRLIGLEPGFNDRAEDRAVVVHGAAYVSRSFAAQHGRLGRSWGCPALPLGVHQRVIETIKDGSAVFAYYPDPTWMRRSSFLRCSENRVVRR